MDKVAESPTAYKPGGTMVVVAYAITIFFSAFLLFQVQPLISKFILPWFGGSPAVWTAAMLFFQLTLFGGYLYAHLTSTYLSPRGQLILHLVLIAGATVLTVVTRIMPPDSLKPTGDESSPMLLILMLLGATVGLPYFVLSSTGPLLQKWFSDAFEGVSPYRLFALSNVGSLLALLSYPFFFEVMWDSREQATMWSIGFVVFGVCCAFCAWWTFRARQLLAISTVRKVTSSASDQAPSIWRWTSWVFLPALASVMFLAVTNEVTQNVAPVPLLWIIPLSLYLISFIVAFDHPRWYSRTAFGIFGLAVLVYMADTGLFSGWISDRLNALFGYTADDMDRIRLTRSWILECSIYFSGLFAVCMICHCEMAFLKPSPKYLTAYFLIMSLGGALGGILVNLVATYAFVTFYELSLALFAATILAMVVLGQGLKEWGKREAWGAAMVLGVLGVLFVANSQLVWSSDNDPAATHVKVHRARNFYGIVGVEHRSRNTPEDENYTFVSGHIKHGRQYAKEEKRNIPIAYWGPGTGCRVAMEYVTERPDCRIGIVGLGIGTIAGFAKEGHYVRMYEINPEVVEIAKNTKWFHYLADCKAKNDIVLGDARLQLEKELRNDAKGNQFDVLCLDAFTGDAVPTHLLTTEAFALYKQHLKPNGIIVVNITNTYLDLFPVVKKLADTHGFKYTRIYKDGDGEKLLYRTYFMLLTNDEGFLRKYPEDIAAMPASFRKERDIPLWTDKYHNLFQILQ